MTAPVLRQAGFQDIPALARMRRLMFEDMETLEQRGFDPGEMNRLETVFADYAASHLGGQLHAWVVEEDDQVVSCAAISVLPYLPGPGRLDMRLPLIHNVYTLPGYRRRGHARRLMQAVLDWARAEGIARVVLNASQEGRPLYENMGFTSTNQMVLTL